FERRRAEERAREEEARDREKASSPASPRDSVAAPVAGKIRNPYKFARLEERILALEERLRAIEAQTGLPEVYLDGARMKALAAEREGLRSELEALYRQWENWS
ncbi:MAG TPA: ABC transporter C-terminal domain-containing protein, partial [Planctomycetota bacterium]|nr:ABC transporter C-terminal domain-containing protein [Planctomycetota bacterium]